MRDDLRPAAGGETGGWRVRAYAKVNLDLRITGIRPDGYHTLQTLYQSIALHDTIVAEPVAGPLTIDTPRSVVPADRSNLVWRAAAALWAALGRPGDPAGARLTLVKRIPVEAGLGGGSADAAATLRLLSRVWGARADEALLADLAASLGADVPYFLRGGLQLGTGRGDELAALPEPPPGLVAVVVPPFGLSTADVYAWFDTDGRRGTPPLDVWPRHAGAWETCWSGLINDLQAPVLARRPALGSWLAILRAAGARRAGLTGSGSALFGWFDAPSTARAARNRLRSCGAAVTVWSTLDRNRYLWATRVVPVEGGTLAQGVEGGTGARRAACRVSEESSKL